jgi:DNA invertase Pin-like site-specific DNA recombinase
MGKLIFTILSAVAEAERDPIRERIRDNKRDGKARGLYLGGRRPHGFQIVDGVLVEDPEQQAARSRILEMRAGGASLRAIAESISRDGLRITHTRRQWGPGAGGDRTAGCGKAA